MPPSRAAAEDFIQSQGIIWLPHILRRLANRFIEGSEAALPDLGVSVPSRAVSIVHLLLERGAQPVTEIALATGQSHPLVISHLRRLQALGITRSRQDRADKRRTLVALTAEGQRQAQRLLQARTAFVAAYDDVMREADAEVFDALWRLEAALRNKSFAERIARAMPAP